MTFILSLLWVFAILEVLVAAGDSHLTWWVDESCYRNGYFTKGVFDKMMAEVIETAELTKTRISLPRDQEPQAYKGFSNIFKFGHDSENIQDHTNFAIFKKLYVDKDSIPDIKKEKEEGDMGRALSEVRIYCDNDKRWELVKDEDPPKPRPEQKGDSDKAGDPNKEEEYVVNSKRDEEKQEWEDSINKLRFIGKPTCLKNLPDAKEGVFMGTYKGTRLEENAAGENFDRVTITICDLHFSTRHYTMTSEIPFWKNLERRKLKPNVEQPIDAWSYITSMIMFHELHHLRRYQIKDKAYQWKGCFALERDDALDNAESFMFLGVLMLGLERGYTIDPNNPEQGAWKQDDTIIKRRQGNTKKRADRYISCKDKGIEDTKESLQCKEFQA